MMKTSVKIENIYDVIVCGGGVSGTIAAIAAAREDSSVLLVEKNFCLGGMATSGLVQPISKWGINGEYVTGGTGKKIISELSSAGKYAATPMSHYGVVCDAEYLKLELERQAVGAGVKILYNTVLTRAVRQNSGGIEKLILFSGNGDFDVKGRVYIDATGDAALAASAGAGYEAGSQGATLMMLISGINEKHLPEIEEIRTIWERKRVNYRPLTLFFHPRGDMAYFNMTEVENLDGLNPFKTSEAVLECRRQAWDIYDVFKKFIPGFEGSYISHTADSFGIRETRRIKGRYVLTGSDVLQGKHFKDEIAKACSPVDIHGSSQGGLGVYKRLKKSYSIPYGCLVTDEITNLIVTGRCISADRTAFSSLRRMATGMAVGEAAGIAAGIASETGTGADMINLDKLQDKLRTHGAVIDS